MRQDVPADDIRSLNLIGPDLPHAAPSRSELPEGSLTARLVALNAENKQIRADLEQLRAERAALLNNQKCIMELLGTKSPERIVHDVRNVLNERELFKTLAGDL